MYINYGYITISWDWHYRRAIFHCHDINLDDIHEKLMLRINFIINDYNVNLHWQCNRLIYARKNDLLSFRYGITWNDLSIYTNSCMFVYIVYRETKYLDTAYIWLNKWWPICESERCNNKTMTVYEIFTLHWKVCNKQTQKCSHGMVNCICTTKLKGVLETKPTLYYDKVDTYCIW